MQAKAIVREVLEKGNPRVSVVRLGGNTENQEWQPCFNQIVGVTKHKVGIVGIRDVLLDKPPGNSVRGHVYASCL